MITIDKSISINTYVDTLGIRCEFNNMEERDNVFKQLVTYVAETKIVGIVYDSLRSSKYYQITKLQYSNSTLATIAKGCYTKEYDRLNPECYYINLSFYGLMRYDKKKDDASKLLIRTITAYLNTCNIHLKLTELDIAMDIKSNSDNILAVCTRKSANIEYYELGDIDKDGKSIQKNNGTYYIEKLTSLKSKKRAMSRAYLYDKRRKEISKFKKNIGFDLTRFELKLQKRFFVKNTYSGSIIDKALDKYTVLYFADIENKELFIQQYNSAAKSKRKRAVLKELKSSNNAVFLPPRLKNIYAFLREIDSVKLDSQGDFSYIAHEDYLYCTSQFNRKY